MLVKIQIHDTTQLDRNVTTLDAIYIMQPVQILTKYTAQFLRYKSLKS